MKRNPIIIFSLVAVASVTVLLARAEKEALPFNLNASTVSELESRLARLEEKVSFLEQENDSLKESIAKLESVSISPKDDWRKMEFNGETFYIRPAAGE